MNQYTAEYWRNIDALVAGGCPRQEVMHQTGCTRRQYAYRLAVHRHGKVVATSKQRVEGGYEATDAPMFIPPDKRLTLALEAKMSDWTHAHRAAFLNGVGGKQFMEVYGR